MNVAELLDMPASMLPEQAILVCQDRSLTYGEPLDHVQRTAGALSELGVERGDHVAAIDTNSVELDGSVDEVERKLRRLGSIGRALPDVEVHIVDEDGQSLAPGEIGEVSLRTPHTVRGYYAQDDATAATIQNGWLLTHDLAWMDEDGYIFLAGRKADLIIRCGENIAPQEVELVLESHPSVDEVAVIGKPDDEWGERVCAVVVARPGSDVRENDLIAWCDERPASFKKPESVILMDALPRNPLGKFMRPQLRAQLHALLPNGEVHAQ